MRNLIVRPRHFGFSNSIDNLYDDVFGIAFGNTASPNFNPAVDIREADDDVKFIFELPGMDKGDIKVWVKAGILSVSGERDIRSENKDNGYLRTEIRSGKFNRSFGLPKTVNPDSITADYKNGILIVTAAKAEEKKPKKIEIKIS
ncbi:MAG: Hsp20/alpha crystallin family protein [candidate division Zixibacteria bacterium]